MMQIYITFIILLSFVHHIKMGGHTKAPATTRLRIFSRGSSFRAAHLFARLLSPVSAQTACAYQKHPSKTIQHLQRVALPSDPPEICLEHVQIARIRQHFHLRARQDRLFCARAHQRRRKLYSSILLSCSFTDKKQGISNFELASLLVTNIWGGWMLQEPRWR